MRQRKLAAILILLGLAVVVAAGMNAAQKSRHAARPPLASVQIDGVPHEQQKPDFCGEACVAMWLRKLGLAGDQDWVFGQTEVAAQLGRGAYANELGHALLQMGFQIGRGWYRVLGGRPDTGAQLDELFAQLHEDLQHGVPSIVCMRYDDRKDSPEHFRLILGYAAEQDAVIYHEPAEADGAYRRMARGKFLELWPLKSDITNWTVVRFRLAGSAITGSRASDGGPPSVAHLSAGYAQHVLALKRRLPEGFSVVLATPFVVIGNGDPKAVQQRADGSVAWAVKRLRESYFSRDPGEIIDIWLFEDDASYRRYTKLLFDEEPETPYGYYSEEHHALFMNIATGGGTLVHEIVHPYLHANFPDAPPWFNEGLGSLYEQCDEVDGKIVGLTNWRLEGLQEHIRAGKLPSFRALTEASSRAFYKGEHRGTGYGQARYLLYYLQQNGKLGEYYRRFYAGQKMDPTGYHTLQELLGEPNMADFQQRWERWVLQLKFQE